MSNDIKSHSNNQSDKSETKLNKFDIIIIIFGLFFIFTIGLSLEGGLLKSIPQFPCFSGSNLIIDTLTFKFTI